MAQETLLSKVPVPPANIFRILGENPDASAAQKLTSRLCESFSSRHRANFRASI